jgi:four helix bundle protein
MGILSRLPFQAVVNKAPRGAQKIRFYRMAKRSATECAGILDVCQRLQLIDDQHHTKGRELIIRIVSMLIKMARR